MSVKAFLADLNECEGEPCVNGECVDAVGTFYCKCPSGFAGENCQSGRSHHDGLQVFLPVVLHLYFPLYSLP